MITYVVEYDSPDLHEILRETFEAEGHQQAIEIATQIARQRGWSDIDIWDDEQDRLLASLDT